MEHARTAEFVATDESMVDAVKHVVRAMLRHKLLLVSALFLTLALAVVYIALAVPRYTSQTLLVIDPTRPVTFISGQTASGSTADSAAVLSQLEILRAERLLSEVMDRADIANIPEAKDKSLSAVVVDFIFSFVGQSRQAVNPDLAQQRRRAGLIRMMRDHTTIERLGITYLISIGYTSRDPQWAARVANTVADVYMEQQQDAKLEALRDTNQWLTSRAQELKKSISESELAAEKFRAENDLYENGGILLGDRELADLASRAFAAQAKAVEAQQKLDSAADAIRIDGVQAALPDAINNALIQKLRERYAEATETLAKFRQERGEEHGSVQMLQRDLDEIGSSIRRELAVILDVSAQDVAATRRQQSLLDERVAALKADLANKRQLQVQLRSMELQTTMARSIYDAFLARAQSIQGEESIPVGARIISSASVPMVPSHPRAAVIMALAFVFGSLLGLTLCLWREHRLVSSHRVSFGSLGVGGAPDPALGVRR